MKSYNTVILTKKDLKMTNKLLKENLQKPKMRESCKKDFCNIAGFEFPLGYSLIVDLVSDDSEYYIVYELYFGDSLIEQRYSKKPIRHKIVYKDVLGRKYIGQLQIVKEYPRETI